MNQSQQQNVSIMATIAVFCTFGLAMGSNAINPAMQTIIQHWAPMGVDVLTVRLMNTVPSLVVVFATILAGWLVGKYVSYRVMAIAGFAIFTIFGTLPAIFNDNFTFILVCRAFLGLGMGLVSPLGAALCFKFYDHQKAAAYVGYGAIVKNFVSIVMVAIAGVLCVMAWELTFYVYLIGIVGLVWVIMFMPEPAPVEQPHAAGEKLKRHIDSYVVIGSITMFVMMIVQFVVQISLSTWFDMLGVGGPGESAAALNFYTAAGIVASLLFGVMNKRIRRWVIPIGLLVGGIGGILVRIGASLPVLTAGVACVGFGFMLVTPAFVSGIGKRLDPASQALGTSIMLASINIGAFLNAYYQSALTAVFGEGYLAVGMTAIAVVFLALAVVYLFFDPMKLPTRHSGEQQ